MSDRRRVVRRAAPAANANLSRRSTVNATKTTLAALLLLGSTVSAGENEAAREAAEESAAAASAGTDAAASPNAAADASADEAEALTPRGRYNLGLRQLAAEEHEAAAETFLAARDDAGPDPQLRYRAAFNLGLALARGVGEDTPPAQAIDTLRRSAAWFNDAVRLAPPGDDDARINLELVSRRVLALADQLNDGTSLQGRLDRLIDDQRGIRDGIRGLLQDATPEGEASERTTTVVLEDHVAFNALASRERALAADVGECIDLATEERLFIEQTPADQLTPEQQGRAYQLQGVTDFLERARQSLSDARRRLRRLDGERAHRRADAALAELKRAREQLFDPLRVLQAAARDQLQLVAETAALATFRDEPLRLAEAPGAWLTAKHLAERQENIGARTGGVLGRFDAVTVANADDANADALQAVVEATPIVENGLAAMRAAIRALESEDPGGAVPEQTHALELLQQAMELFAGAKELIELAYAGQRNIVALLTPTENEEQRLSAAERAEALFAGTTDNQRRLRRLGTVFEQEARQADAQAAEEQASGEAERQRQAEALRERALTALDSLADWIGTHSGNAGDASIARAAAAEALAALEELRRLFFTIVEHIQALHGAQADTHDATATLQFESTAAADDNYATRIEATANQQAQHGQLGDALAQALARQADAASAQAAQGADAQAPAAPGAGDEQATAAETMAAQLAEAATEVRKAGGRMAGAAATLADGAARAATMSPELEPALEDQIKALDHLENALRALSPPDGEQQDQQSGGDQGGEQAQAQQSQGDEGMEERMSQRQALKRLQAIRDREAQRQRRRTDAVGSEPVEKDW